MSNKPGRPRKPRFVVQTQDQQGDWTPCRKDAKKVFYHAVKSPTEFRERGDAELFLFAVLKAAQAQGIGIKDGRVAESTQ